MRPIIILLSLVFNTPQLSLAQDQPDSDEVAQEESPQADSTEESENEASEALTSEDEDILPVEDQVPLSVQVQVANSVYDKDLFTANSLQLITEWYPSESLPLKLGANISYQNLSKASADISGGQFLQIAARASYFWDLDSWAPYIAVEKSLLTSGSVDLRKLTDENVSLEATSQLKIDSWQANLRSSI